MKIVAGWHCPDLLSGPGNYLSKNVDAQRAFTHVRKWRTAVQAGGHIGTWPVMLGALFQTVVTFEPEADNFTCLVANLSERSKGNVFPVRGCVGRKRAPVGLRKSAKSTGQHRVGTGEMVPCFRIDDLGFADLDALFLDVEGFEVAALQGAHRTLERCRPVVMVEENRRCLDQGFQLGDAGRLLERLGYRKVAAVNEDLVFAPGPHP